MHACCVYVHVSVSDQKRKRRKFNSISVVAGDATADVADVAVITADVADITANVTAVPPPANVQEEKQARPRRGVNASALVAERCGGERQQVVHETPELEDMGKVRSHKPLGSSKKRKPTSRASLAVWPTHACDLQPGLLAPTPHTRISYVCCNTAHKQKRCAHDEPHKHVKTSTTSVLHTITL